MDGIVHCRHENDWQVGTTLDVAASRYKFETAHDWHHEVEHNEVGQGQLQLLERLLAIRGLTDQISFVSKDIAQEPANNRLVIDYEYPPGKCWLVAINKCGVTQHKTTVRFARSRVMKFVHSSDSALAHVALAGEAARVCGLGNARSIGDNG